MVNMRAFTAFERENIKFLVNHNVKFTQVEVTPTGLEKSILDSTAPMRAYFLENGIHNYEEQQQGLEHKQYKPVSVLTESTRFDTKASFYRPNTKKGDPRMWIYGFGSYTKGNDIHVLFWYEEILFSINITRIDIEKCYDSSIITPMQEILKSINTMGNSVSEELLSRFRSVRNQWFESEVVADTGIGRTIESFLGISMNSDKKPDYKGIELKSHREMRSSKKNVLFTQTPDWDISVFKSGREIVEKFGYYAANGKKTYQNTVQCSPPNSQNLFLNVNQVKALLELQSYNQSSKDVAVWRLMKLHQRLLTKHRETFWIEVENRMDDGKEYFRYKQIEHTKNPTVGQFDILLEQNLITVDLLLCRPSGNGDTYSFKIKKSGMPLLFPESVFYEI
ncbi:MAG: MvaI/BcnI restriction endonuclease family protein [Paludibacteraceae bacterium]|nr:MvaI/BcnI restriction endonuclease family protein [Paludibacteraceae bacterium]